MTLTIGTGPFGNQGEKTFNFEVRAPRDHVLYFEDSPRRVRVVFGGETVADSRRVKLMHEKGSCQSAISPKKTCAWTCWRRVTTRLTAPSRAKPRIGP
jgi:hypothetical protein